MNFKDKELFYFENDSTFNRNDYADIVITGSVKYLLNESPDALPKAKRKYVVLKYLHYGLISITLFIFLWFTLHVCLV